MGPVMYKHKWKNIRQKIQNKQFNNSNEIESQYLVISLTKL